MIDTKCKKKNERIVKHWSFGNSILLLEMYYFNISKNFRVTVECITGTHYLWVEKNGTDFGKVDTGSFMSG